MSTNTNNGGLNLVYKGGILHKVLTGGGYIETSDSTQALLTTPAYRFFLTDHLGSVRVVADAAGFWQGVGKIFGADLKKKYDPEGIDKQTEELVQMWQRGEFEGFYYSIFGKLPESPELGLKHKYGLPSIQESSSTN
ncbi:MAG: DUF4294 domain-containing protein [Bacteroidales bacterium]|nr:DUF4294 domain-containing protein [Bacteroidales bacterium]